MLVSVVGDVLRFLCLLCMSTDFFKVFINLNYNATAVCIQFDVYVGFSAETLAGVFIK